MVRDWTRVLLIEGRRVKAAAKHRDWAGNGILIVPARPSSRAPLLHDFDLRRVFYCGFSFSLKPVVKVAIFSINSPAESQFESALMNEDGLDFKSPQTIIVVLAWLKKLDIARREFCRQCIRIWDVKISVSGKARRGHS